MHVVLVEDDEGVAGAVIDGLRAHGFPLVDHFREGLDLLTFYPKYDVVILDLGLPDVSGYLVLRQLRKVSSVPVVVLTADSNECAVVSCLRAGADDFVVKPPRVSELAARLEAVTRRRSGDERPPAVVVLGDIRVDVVARTVDVAGEPIQLTQKEFELARVLAERAGAAVSRDQIMTEIWGETTPSVSRSLDVHMGALRAKLNRPGRIATIHGYGYRWSRSADSAMLGGVHPDRNRAIGVSNPVRPWG
ncbi:response regulator transcription factor [Nocardia sp. NEAU-G5]|uniref:Response regulator transcription factor n=1 Tax=Nocardia albiluteola TaxID=2842303 RepID=A0ABS6B529_9NOCA|nr:response regulator transcription factor [Nocardia albiluteola]MBU3064875.1 response regulator transcription factor [Nocardia albiluteola]